MNRMGLYFIRCRKCGRDWTFCSVGEPHILGEPCSCDFEFQEEYTPGKIIL